MISTYYTISILYKTFQCRSKEDVERLCRLYGPEGLLVFRHFDIVDENGRKHVGFCFNSPRILNNIRTGIISFTIYYNT